MKRILLFMLLCLVSLGFSQTQNALSFDGTDDCVNISAAVTSATTTQPITIEAWIYPTTDSDTRLIASKYYGGDASKCNFLLTRNPSQKIFIAANGSNVITSNGTVPLNAWTHIAVVFQSGTNNTKIYINGILDISGSLTYNTVNTSTVMQIGQFTNITSYPVYQEWAGNTDEFRLWNTVRTQAQIYENMNAPLTGSETGLVAYYGFNQGTANGTNTGLTTLTDLTGHGWNGALVGFALTGSISNWVGGVTFSPPPSPAALEATYISSSFFTANWSSSTGSTGYKLDIATDSLFTQYVSAYNDLDVGDVTECSITGLSDQTTYYYRVRAYNPIGSSGNSNIVSVFTEDPLVPDVPSAFSAENITTDSFRAVWSLEDRAWGYYIDVASDSSFSDHVAGYSAKDVGNTTSVTVIPLAMDTEYFYRVRAYNAGGTSESSNTVYVKTIYSTAPVATAPFSGSGTAGDPYVIANLNNLYWIAENSTRWGYHYIQTADIDAGVTKYWFAGQGWTPIGNYTTKFTGSYKGDQHLIERLYINRPSQSAIGLFGCIAGASISNLGLTYCEFTASKNVGGIAGSGYYADGSVSNIEYCFTSGEIISTDDSWNYAGGIIGEGDYTSVNNCYSYCNVYGIKYAGGLVGDISGASINNSYSTGNVNPPVNISYWNGGLCGGSGGTIASSFWDTETSGYTTSHGGIGKTTVQMMTQSTFTSADWDFVDTWESAEGYPRLKWQDYTPDFVATLGASDITSSTIRITGSVYSIGELPIIQHGVCWNTTGNPTVNDLKTDEGSMVEAEQFITQMTGLYQGTLYYTRTYISNGKAVVYGKQITVSTSQIAFEQPAGDGTEIDPYQISSLENLYWMSSGDSEVSTPPRSVRWASHYVQTADIDASATGTWFSGQGWIPVGDAETQFTGKYNGQGHIITGLSIERTIDGYDLIEFIGLFGYIVNSEIRNVNLINTNIKGGKYVGGIAGYSTSSVIDNCSSEGFLQGSFIGGIAGDNNNSTISNSSSLSEISCWVPDSWEGHFTSVAGGLVGINSSSVIINCSYDSILHGADLIGGLVGYNRVQSQIKNCYSKGSVSGANKIGGLVGNNIEGSTITDSYNTGSVQGDNEVGGLVGYNDYSTVFGSSTVTNCYSTGTVTGVNRGGLIGINDGESIIQNSYWDINTSGLSWSAGGIGLLTPEMRNKSIYIAKGWDFIGESTNGTEDFWNIHPFYNDGYPFLNYQEGVPPGDGSIEYPYLISCMDDLVAISENYSYWNYNYLQTDDIDASETVSLNAGAGWTPIGNYNHVFSGTYNGQNYDISGLYIYSSTADYVGFFGKTSGAYLSNINLTGVSITADSYVGGVSGYNIGSTVENCSSTGSVTGNASTGGLVGANWNSSIISNSWSDCNVEGITNTGGLVGYNYNSSSVGNCYSRSNIVSAGSYGGGLVGRNFDASINYCYSTGAVSGDPLTIGGLTGCTNTPATASFWDTESSGLITSPSGTGKTTAEMKAIATFTNAGWDFTGETANGTNDYWNIGTFENDGYPYLSWQMIMFESPQNVNGTMTGADFILNWNEVSGASSYSVYSTEDPYAAFPTGWNLENSGIAGSSWTDFSVTAAKKFYVVVAVTAKAENINQSVKVEK